MLTDDSKNRFYEFKVLEHVEASPTLTARMAAAKLGCSVKLTHGLLGKMVERGLLHVKKINSRRWDYFLTPHGIAEKTRLAYEFLQFSMQFYHEARRRSSQLCRDLKENGIDTIAILGAGDLAEIVFLGIKQWQLELVEVFDPKPGNFLGLDILPPERLPESRARALIICSYDPAKPMDADYLPPNTSFHIPAFTVFGKNREIK